MATDDEITGLIVDVALGIHRKLGPGLLESAYEAVLARSLEVRGVQVVRQRLLPFEFEGIRFENSLRVDMLVESRIVVELKSTERLHPVYTKQVLTYLRLLNLQVGLLINFGGETLREGIRRVVNNYRSPSLPAQDSSAPPRSPRLRVHRFHDP